MIRAPAPFLVALLVPLVFLHIHYQPSWTIGLGSTSATINLSDLAVLGVGAVGIVFGIQHGFAPLRAGRAVLVVGAAFLALVLAATVYPLALEDHYQFAKHLVTALKLCEYALLALGLPLVLRRKADAFPLFAALTAWSVAASGGAVLQFLGVINELEGRRPGQREPSFIGIHDLAALSGGVLALALVAIALGASAPHERAVAVVAGISGTIGLVLSGAAAGVAGLAAAVAAVVFVAWRRGTLSMRRFVALVAIVGVVLAGVLALRNADIDSFLRFVGVRPAEQRQTFKGESYAQRSVLAYIGWRIVRDHPLVGVGWQGSTEQESYGPYLGDARRRFPDVPALSFPAPEHPWGIQNAYIQAAAELGVAGLALFLAVFLTGLGLATRAALRAPAVAAAAASVPVLWLLVTMGVYLGLGLVAGTPLVGLQWLSLGLAAAAANWISDGRARRPAEAEIPKRT